jgi:hypothetical protein
MDISPFVLGYDGELIMTPPPERTFGQASSQSRWNLPTGHLARSKTSGSTVQKLGCSTPLIQLFDKGHLFFFLSG